MDSDCPTNHLRYCGMLLLVHTVDLPDVWHVMCHVNNDEMVVMTLVNSVNHHLYLRQSVLILFVLRHSEISYHDLVDLFLTDHLLTSVCYNHLLIRNLDVLRSTEPLQQFSMGSEDSVDDS